jgi:hypothetical protein
MKITPFLVILNQIKIFHWQTRSYAEHKALGEAYESLDGLFDKLIETYYGKYGRPTDQIEYTFKAFTYKPELATTIKDYRDQLMSELSSVLTEQDLDLLNLKDEIEGQFNHLLYLLTLK